jgi:hypothetical protein
LIDGGSHGVRQADDRLLRDTLLAGAGEREDRRCQHGEAEREPVSPLGARVIAQQEGDGGSQRGDLRQGDVHEDHLAAQDVDPEIGVDAGQDQARGEGKRQDLDRLRQGHGAPFRSSEAAIREAMKSYSFR